MKTNILLVGPESNLEALFRQHFRHAVQDGTYEFAFAGNGQQALRMLEEQASIDVVLISVTGLDLLDELRRINSVARTIVLTPSGDLTTIRQAMNRGAFATITRPINIQDLKATIDSARQYVHQLRETQELMSRDGQKTQVFSTITHELRSPLSQLAATVDQLCETADLPLTQPLIAVRRNARQLLRLLNELTAITQIETPKVELANLPGRT
ncbi:response regulator [Larkinella terrae]|nr:response regulator [Larkinella terrae]